MSTTRDLVAGVHPEPQAARRQGWLQRTGCRVSEAVADVSADPLAQIGLVIFSVAWFVLGLPVEVFTAFLSILAITLTQMVLNKQNQREADAHRRDVALHAKIDELVHASKRARDELAGIEELEEEEIERVRQAVAPPVSAAVSAPPRRRTADAAKQPRAAVAAARPRR